LAISGAVFAGSHHHGTNGNNTNTTNQNAQKPATPPTTTPPPASTQPSQLTQDETAQTAAVDALHKAQAALKEVSDGDWTTYTQSADWTAAQTKLTTAQSDLDSAKQAASDALNSNPDYQAAVAAKKKATDDLAAAKTDDDASPEKLAPLATASLQASIDLRKIQGDLLANNTGVQTASDNLTAAQHTVDLLKAKFQQTLLADKNYTAAKSAVDTAQQAYDDAHQKVLSASSGG
jgi:hypothetical protein